MEILKRIEQLINAYTKNNIRIALAESCTGGFICHMITNISGSSKVFDRGVVSYSNQAKIEILNVDAGDIEKFGAVSEPVAHQMAKNIRTLSNTDIGVGVTGIAGPTGGTEEKPVGLVYIGFSTADNTEVHKFQIDATRIGFKQKVLEKVIGMCESIL